MTCTPPGRLPAQNHWWRLQMLLAEQVQTGSVADTLPEGLTPRKPVRGAARGGADDPAGALRADSDGRPSAGKTTPPVDALPGADLPPVLASSRSVQRITPWVQGTT